MQTWNLEPFKNGKDCLMCRSELAIATSSVMGVALGKPHPLSQTQFLPLEYGSVPRNLGVSTGHLAAHLCSAAMRAATII